MAYAATHKNADDDEDGIERKPRFCKALGLTQIGHQTNNKTLLSGSRPCAASKGLEGMVRRQQEHHRDVALGAQLAGQPHQRPGANPIQSGQRLRRHAHSPHRFPRSSYKPPPNQSRLSQS
jgi:hypothetical protein